MKINLQKISICLLVLMIFISISLNTTFVQSKIIKNYFANTNQNANFLIDFQNFDYDIISGDLETDVLLNNFQNNDSLISVENISLNIPLINLIFSKNLKIRNVTFDNLNLNFNDISKLKTNLISNDSKKNNPTKNIFIENLRLNNSVISLKNGNNYKLKQISSNNLLISSKKIDVEEVKIDGDDFISISDLNYQNRELKLRLDSFLTNSKSNFITQIFGIDYLSRDSIKDIDLNGELSLSEDSLNFKSNVKYGDSSFDIMTKKVANKLFFTLSNSNINLSDVPNLINRNYFSTDSISLKGNFSIEKEKVDSIETIISNGFFETIFGDFTFDLNGNFDERYLDILVENFNSNKILHQELKFTNSSSRIKLKKNVPCNILTKFSNLKYLGKSYDQIIVDSKLSDDNINLQMTINDQNVFLDYTALIKSLNINNPNEFPELSNVVGRFKVLNPSKHGLNINDNIIKIESKFFVDKINFNNYSANIDFENFSYLLNNEYRNVNKLNINTNFLNSKEFLLDVSSDYGSVNLNSTFDGLTSQSFQLDVNLNDASFFSEFFINDLTFDDTLVVDVDYNNLKFDRFYIDSKQIIFSEKVINGLNVTDKNDLINCSADTLKISDDFSLNNLDFTFENNLDDSEFFVKCFSNLGNSFDIDLIGNLHFSNNNFIFKFYDNSILNISNNIWEIDTSSRLRLNYKGLFFNNFRISQESENLFVNGMFNKKSDLHLEFIDFNISNFNPIINSNSLYFNGLMQGNMVYNKSLFPSFFGNFFVNELTFNDVFLGKLEIDNSFNHTNDSLISVGKIFSENHTFKFDATYPFDGTKKIDADLIFDNFPTDVLSPIIKPLSNISGNTNGKVKVFGKFDNFNVLGDLMTNNLSFDVPYLGQSYVNTQDTLVSEFKNDSILLKKFKFFDKKFKTNAYLNAEIYHNALKNLNYEISVDADSLFVLNTNESDNPDFYGDVFLDGTMLVNGKPENVVLDINATTQDGTKIKIPLIKSKEVRENIFIRFNNYDLPKRNISNQAKKPMFKMNFNLEINNNAEIEIIFDKEVGDLIKAIGDGSLLLKINDDGDFEVFGDFYLQQGNYLFTLQDVITKSFQIDNDGLISFNGYPSSASINLDVLYNVQASLNPLNPDFERQVKSPVVCGIKMYDKLLNPEIEFFIEIPNSDQVVQTSLETITNTDQKLLEQFLYLLLANSFLVENDPSIDYLGNTLATTGTELLSNQLSNWLSQTTDAFDLGFKWIPGTGDSLSYQQVELAISRKFLDDRVIVNGNVGTPPEQSEADIIGDLDIEYNFFKDGRFKLRVFNRAEDYDPFSESTGYEQGFGIFFKKQFDSFKDIFDKKNKN